MNILEEFKSKIIGAYLDSFGVKKQFLELELSSKDYELICVHIDCSFTSSDIKLNTISNSLKNWDIDVYNITIFIGMNRGRIIDCYFDDKNNFVLKIHSGYKVIFNLSNQVDYASSLSFSFKEKLSTSEYTYFDIMPNGTIIKQ